MLEILRTRRGQAIGGAVAGLGIAGGSAIAAILLTTSIIGQASVDEISTANRLTAEVSAVNGTQLNCKDLSLSGDFKTLTFNPKLTKVSTSGNATGAPVPGGSCTISVVVENIGTTALKVDGTSELVSVPAGWTVTDFSGPGLSPIAPKASGAITAKLTATDKAVAGPITGKLVYTDA